MKEHQAPGKSTKPIAGLAALLVCLPAFGASSIDVICDDADIAKIEDTVTEFSAQSGLQRQPPDATGRRADSPGI